MLWSSGGFTLRMMPGHVGPGRGEAMIVKVDSPFALIGRGPGAGVRIDDPAVSSRHVYLHLDHRGLFAVDLATRTGTRVGPDRTLSGWLQAGDRLEVAGCVIEVLALDFEDDQSDHDGHEPRITTQHVAASPLDDTGDRPLVRLTLYPDDPPREPLSLNSELVFVGRSTACGVPVTSPSAMRVQCVLVRDLHTAHLVDLVGRGTWVNDRPVAKVATLADGDNLMVGSARFSCRVEPHDAPRAGLPALSLGIGLPSSAGSPWPTELMTVENSPSAWSSDPSVGPPLHLIPPEAQGAVLGWMMGQIQGRQDEAIRRQSDFQTELVRLVAEIHRDNHAVLNRHLERADAIHRELSELRDELKKRFGEQAAAVIPALSAPRPAPLKVTPSAPPESPEAAANWLISRVNQLDQENRKGWKDLLGRLSGRKDD
jgi:pSer/pThr/pTyr-binding forkhead associated (FHA) protein